MMNKDTANGRVSGVRLVRMLLAGGGQVAILPHGGRVLGLYAPGSDENFLWTNPALDDAISAKALLASDQWHNTGGDRTWLAPENDFFRPDYPKMETYFQPRALDPGRYRCTRTERGVRLACDLKLHSYRTREDLWVIVASPRQHVGAERLVASLVCENALKTTLMVTVKLG